MVTLWDFIHEMGLNDMTCTGKGGGGGETQSKEIAIGKPRLPAVNRV